MNGLEDVDKKVDVECLEESDASVTKDEMVQAQIASLSEGKSVMQTFREDRKAMLVVCCALLNAFILGTDTTIVGSLVGSQSFAYTMGNGYKNGSKYAVRPETVTIWNACGAPAQIIGQFATAPIADYFGRRTVIWSAIFLMMLGVVLEICAPNWQAFTAASFMMKLVAGMVQSTAPLYVSELAPRSVRGILICAFLMISATGDIIIAVLLWYAEIRWPTFSNKWGYRMPLMVCLVLPLIVVTIQVFFLCESPSWLIMRGQPDKARKAIKFMYPKRSEEEREIVFAEYEYTLQKINENKEIGKQASYLDCFRGVDLRRTFCAFWPAMTISLAGNAIIGPQKTYFFTLSGQTNSLASTCIAIVVGMCGTFLCFCLIEHKRPLGRRRMILIGQCGELVSMVGIGITALVSTQPYSKEVGSLMLAFLCIGAAAVQFGPTGVGWTYMGESGSLRLKAKTTVFGALGNGLVGVVYNVAIPYMVESPSVGGLGIGGSCLFFAGWGVICIIVTFFMIPDFTGRSAAQIDELFVRRVPARQWREFQCTGDYGRDILHQHEEDKTA